MGTQACPLLQGTSKKWQDPHPLCYSLLGFGAEAELRPACKSCLLPPSCMACL